ncbi:MAG TPA: hypothetical protein VF784_13255 [Anaerolineales bacterium]
MCHRILIAHRDQGCAQALAVALHAGVPSVRVVGSHQELTAAIPKYRPDVVVCDLETVELDRVKKLALDEQVLVICTHRVPDEFMWTAALEAGALDCCALSDPGSILLAIERNRQAMVRAA